MLVELSTNWCPGQHDDDDLHANQESTKIADLINLPTAENKSSLSLRFLNSPLNCNHGLR